MEKITKTDNHDNLFNRITTIVEDARRKTLRRINKIITKTYWKTDKIILEEEQNGKKRANYRKRLLEQLSKNLSQKYGRGFSVDNFESMRKSFILYLNYQKYGTMSQKSLISASINTKKELKDG